MWATERESGVPEVSTSGDGKNQYGMGLTGLGVQYETDVPDTGKRNGIKLGVVPDKFHEKQNYIYFCRPMKHRTVQSNTFLTAPLYGLIY
jgi:hypothetical protein